MFVKASQDHVASAARLNLALDRCSGGRPWRGKLARCCGRVCPGHDLISEKVGGVVKKLRNPCGINLEGRNTQSVNSVNFGVFLHQNERGKLGKANNTRGSYFRGSKGISGFCLQGMGNS